MTTLTVKITTDIAINELLLRKGKEFSRFNIVGTFKGCNGGEGPACAASYLVLDWGYSTSFNPVNVTGKCGLVDV